MEKVCPLLLWCLALQMDPEKHLLFTFMSSESTGDLTLNLKSS